jgi:hypothetical protein
MIVLCMRVIQDDQFHHAERSATASAPSPTGASIARCRADPAWVSSNARPALTGILAQAEVFGLIPSLTASLAQLRPEPATDPDRRHRQRLSQQRSRARRKGQPVPRLKAGPRRPPA